MVQLLDIIVEKLELLTTVGDRSVCDCAKLAQSLLHHVWFVTMAREPLSAREGTPLASFFQQLLEILLISGEQVTDFMRTGVLDSLSVLVDLVSPGAPLSSSVYAVLNLLLRDAQTVQTSRIFSLLDSFNRRLMLGCATCLDCC
jgi:hypothetical protein